MSKSLREKKRDDLRWELIVFADRIKLSGRAEGGGAYQALKDMSAALSGNQTAPEATEPSAGSASDDIMTAQDITEEADRLGSRLRSAGYYDSIQGALESANLSSVHTTSLGERIDTLHPILTLRDLGLRNGGFEAQIVASTDPEVLSVLQRKHDSIENTVRNLISTVVDHSFTEPELDDAGADEPTFPVGSRSADEMLHKHTEHKKRAQSRDIEPQGDAAKDAQPGERKQGTTIALAMLVLVVILFVVLGLTVL